MEGDVICILQDVFFLQAWVSGRAAARQYKWLRPAGATKSLSKWHLLNIEYPIEWYVCIYIWGIHGTIYIVVYIYILYQYTCCINIYGVFMLYNQHTILVYHETIHYLMYPDVIDLGQTIGPTRNSKWLSWQLTIADLIDVFRSCWKTCFMW